VRIGIRVAGVDKPEMRGKCKQEKDLPRQAKQITVEALRSAKVIELRNTKRGKYFRIVADVYVDNKNLTDILISLGLGWPMMVELKRRTGVVKFVNEGRLRAITGH